MFVGTFAGEFAFICALGLHPPLWQLKYQTITLLMKAIATLAALLCSVAFTFAQEGASKPAKPVRSAQASSQVEAVQKEANQKEAVQKVETSQTEESMNLWEMLQKGGWAMIPLGGLSVLTGMLVVGFAITIRRGTVASRQYLATVEVLIRKKDYLGVLAVSNRHGEALARVVQRALDFATKNPGVPFESLKEVAVAEGSAQASSMLHRVAYLADIGVLAPMVGLFGTVMGIIRSFAAIGNGSSSCNGKGGDCNGGHVSSFLRKC